MFVSCIKTNKIVVSLSRFTSTPDKTLNKYYLGPAPMKDMAKQIATAFGPCGNNRDYIFSLEKAMFDIGKQSLNLFHTNLYPLSRNS